MNKLPETQEELDELIAQAKQIGRDEMKAEILEGGFPRWS